MTELPPPAPNDGAPAEGGLSSADVRERRMREGFNELPTAAASGVLRDILNQLREPMSLLLLLCGSIYALLGDRQEAGLLLGFVLFIMLLSLFQERKSNRALNTLRDLASPRALVVRDGQRVRVAGRELVRDDLIVLAEGDRVPADAVICQASQVTVDESLLTGESMSVRKTAGRGDVAFARPGGDDLPFVYAGTLVTGGSGLARVHAIGVHTEVGRIGASLQTREAPQETLLQAEARRLVVRLGWLGAALSLIAALAYGIAQHDALAGLLAGLTLAMAILPNEFPVVVAMFLALGAWRLARRRVLVRRVPVVESLGAVTVLCVDKTGTLTTNRMAVSRIAAAAGERFDLRSLGSTPLPESMHETVEYSILASRRDPFDPMERAFKELGQRQLLGTEHLHDDWQLVREYPLTRERLAVIRVWRSGDDRPLVAAAKGAPEAIAALCGLVGAERAGLEERCRALASDGLRVLAVARASVSEPTVPDDPSRLGFQFVGVVGLADPLREGVPAAVQECRAAGIRVLMITGDYPSTARAVARDAGIDATEVVTGAELAQLSEHEIADRVRRTSVFARMLPEQKLTLVRSLAAQGEIVAMTGDGVNDAPALRAAHVGVAMGARGTDVAREAAAVVLLDDDFAALVHGIRTGRRIGDNLRKALAYILAVHLPIVGLTLVPIALGWPLVLMPIHLAFLHLVIDPACSIVFEGQPAEPTVMRRPPRAPKSPMFGRRVILWSVVQGLSVFAVVLGLDYFALQRGMGEAAARTVTFSSFFVANLSLIFSNRAWSRSRDSGSRFDATLWLVTAAAIAFLGLIIYLPALAHLFRFARLGPVDLALCAGGGVLSVAWFGLLKRAGHGRPWSAEFGPR